MDIKVNYLRILVLCVIIIFSNYCGHKSTIDTPDKKVSTKDSTDKTGTYEFNARNNNAEENSKTGTYEFNARNNKAEENSKTGTYKFNARNNKAEENSKTGTYEKVN